MDEVATATAAAAADDDDDDDLLVSEWVQKLVVMWDTMTIMHMQ
jgi:hypothetical protein